MLPKSPAVLILLLFALALAEVSADDWPWWRGPTRDGHADPNQDPPIEFGQGKKVKWGAEIPGRSHGSATVVGDRVYVAAADEEKKRQSVWCFDRDTGERIWERFVHEGGLTQKSNKKASWASGTPACDGERLFINFVNDDAAYTTALNLNGKLLWQTRITDYKIHQGYGSSPTIWENLVIVSADNKLGGAICGLDRASGKIAWRHERAKMPNYPSPVILEAAGKTQLFMTGTEKVTSLDPLTGDVNWEIDGATTECVSSTITDGKHIYTSGGYPRNHIAAVTADGSGKVAWETKDRVYVPSMLVKDGHLYAVLDGGVAMCWKSDTGEELWKGRLGGNFSSSPVLVGDRIYAVNEAGDLYVFKAQASGLEILAKNKVGDEVFATPSICGGEIFLRVALYKGEKRSEKLICFGE